MGEERKDWRELEFLVTYLLFYFCTLVLLGPGTR